MDEQLRAIFREYAERLASGEVVSPPEYMRRCYNLRRRGLSHRHATALWHAGSPALLRSIERATDADLLALNSVSTT